MDEVRKSIIAGKLRVEGNLNNMFKGKPADPIGTVRNGRKKVGPNKWVNDKEGNLKAKHADRVIVMENGKKVSYARKDAVAQGYTKKHFIGDK